MASSHRHRQTGDPSLEHESCKLLSDGPRIVGTRLCASRPRAIASAGRVVLWCVLTTSAFAQCALAAQPASEEGVPVIYRGQEIVRIYRGVGGMDPVERARLVSERLNQLVRDPDFDPTRLTVSDRETYSELVHDDRVLGVVTDEDAQAIGRPRAEYARQVPGSPGQKSSPPRERSSASGRLPSALEGCTRRPRSWRSCCGCSRAWAADSTNASRTGTSA